MYIKINGIYLYYEVKGHGKPFILLHGNMESHKVFDILIEELSKKFTVFALDSRDHGQSTRTNKITYDLLVEDVVSFIKEFNLDKPLLYGLSDGAIVGLLIASRHPDLLSKLVASGPNSSPDTIRKGWLISIKISYFLFRKDKLRMMLEEPHIKAEDLKRIKVPTLILAGEKEFATDEDLRFIADNIPNAQLKVLKGENHSGYVVHSPKLYKIMEPFIQE